MNRHQEEYIFRINRVIDYIEHNLDKDLTLSELAGVANFSPFHFHRIFSAFMKETLSDFIKRKRVEKAASFLLNEPSRPVSDIASYCGFNSVSVFCRAFRERYGTTAGVFRSGKNHFSKNSQSDSNNSKFNQAVEGYVYTVNLKRELIMKKNIEIKEQPEMDVIYCRHTGNFEQIGIAYNKLFRWAGPRGLLSADTRCITFYHDDPKVTEISKVRQSACLLLKKEVKPEGEIGRMQIPGGKYVVGHFEILPEEFQESWDSVCFWMAENGYQPEDGNPYELYLNNKDEHPEKKFIVDICIPVKLL